MMNRAIFFGAMALNDNRSRLLLFLSPIFLADSDFLVDLIITLLEARLRRGARKAHSIFPGRV